MITKKFRVWNSKIQKFEHFDLYNMTVPDYFLARESLNQFIGILDSNMKEIYEEDVVRFKTDFKADIGVVRHMNDYCSYVVEVEEGYDLFADISFDSLEVIGNMIEDYMYDEKGELVKRETIPS
jgi:hypothetical protein